MDLEMLGIAALEASLAKTDQLQSFLSKRDKEPIWDGLIHIHKGKTHQKADDKKVYVQVKCKKCSYTNAKRTIKYPIEVADLNGFMNNGGAIFFVVCVNENSGDTLGIYYAALLPFKIVKLKEENSATEAISVELDRFPDGNNDKVEVFLNAYKDGIKQTSFAGITPPSVDDLQKQGVLDSLTLSYTGFAKKYDEVLFPKLAEGKEMYLYANVKGGVAPVPVEYYKNISHIVTFREIVNSVKANGTEYYHSYMMIADAENITLKVGSSLIIKFPNNPDPPKTVTFTITVKLQGTLKQRIQAIRFITAMIEAQQFYIGGLSLPANFPQTELDKMHVKDYPSILSSYLRLQRTLDKLNVTKDLDYDKCSSEDIMNINTLITAIDEEKPVYGIKEGQPNIVNLVISNIRIVLLCKKNDDGSYSLWNFFDTHFPIVVIDENKHGHPTSQYAIMTKDEFLTVDNINYPNILNDFQSVDPQEWVIDSANLLLLEMLKAYDERQNDKLFSLIKSMADWLTGQTAYIPYSVVTINRLQITARERPLTYAEKQSLNDIIATEQDAFCRIGAFLILDEQEEANKLFTALTDKQRKTFKEFPIYKFCKQKTEDVDNGQA